MASSVRFHPLLLPISSYSPKRNTENSLCLSRSQFLSPKSLSRLKKELLFSNINGKNLRRHQSYSLSVVVAAQFNFLRVLQTAFGVAKDGIEAGTNLVPDSVPRPIARIGVGGVALTISLFVLKSFLSTAFFTVAMMGFIYFVFIAMNKDDGPRGGGGGGPTNTDDSLEEARRIMEKYK